jgi:hypothetical protein
MILPSFHVVGSITPCVALSLSLSLYDDSLLFESVYCTVGLVFLPPTPERDTAGKEKKLEERERWREKHKEIKLGVRLVELRERERERTRGRFSISFT